MSNAKRIRKNLDDTKKNIIKLVKLELNRIKKIIAKKDPDEYPLVKLPKAIPFNDRFHYNLGDDPDSITAICPFSNGGRFEFEVTRIDGMSGDEVDDSFTNEFNTEELVDLLEQLEKITEKNIKFVSDDDEESDDE